MAEPFETISVETLQVACDGGEGALGHPRVWLAIPEDTGFALKGWTKARYENNAADNGIQIHGAVGYTWECNAHLFYKRGRLCRAIDGTPEYHHERLLQSQGL